MSAVWNPLFGRDGMLCEVIDSCRINYHGRKGMLVVDEGKVIGGYTDVMFYPDDTPKNGIKLFGGSLFNSKRKESIIKFNQLKKQFATDCDITFDNKNQNNINPECHKNDQIEGQIEGHIPRHREGQLDGNLMDTNGNHL